MSLTLRRSVWGSLRSATPFSSSSHPQESIPGSNQHMRPISRNMPFGRTKRANSAPRGKVVRRLPRTITMTAFDAEGRPPPPELDREVDLAGFLELEDDPAPPYSTFEKLHPQRDQQECCCSSFFHLPPKVKHLVYSFCFPEEQRKITLSPRFATKAVFDDEYFASPWEILDPVWGGLAASQDFRIELLSYFWTEYQFHVSLNPFSGPKLSPLSHIWLPQYLRIIQHLTVEVDLTRFGGSALKYASTIGSECGKLERLVIGLLESLQHRSDELMMTELIILSRMYLGSRPVDGVYITHDEVPWHANQFDFLRDGLAGFRGLVRRCRIAGFPLEYTKEVLISIFSDLETTARFVEPRDSAWPPLPLYEPPVRAPTAFNAHSMVPYPQIGSKFATTTRRSTHGTDDEPEIPSSDCASNIDSMVPCVNNETASSHSEWELTLHHSTSFTEIFEQGINGSQESLSSNYATSNFVEGEAVQPFPQLKETSHTLAEHVKNYQSLLPPIAHSPASTARNSPRTVNFAPRSSCPEGSGHSLTKNMRRHEDLSPMTTCSELLALHNPSTELVSNARSPRSPEARRGSPLSATDPPTPTPLRRRGLPPSMSVMNALNEQDPAFIRTMDALRLREEPPVRPSVERSQTALPARPSVMETAGRSYSSLSTRSVNGVKKRYTSFFSRFRGRESA